MRRLRYVVCTSSKYKNIMLIDKFLFLRINLLAQNEMFSFSLIATKILESSVSERLIFDSVR